MDSNVGAFYLKYRPQTLGQLIGQEAVKNTISQAFKSNRLSHAYLFVGPRGTGKTSMARILAKMVNCETKDAPCNKCQTCTSITDGSNLDLIEIDAASNRGIEDIRSLRERIKLAPSQARRKVYIIDEVHMLTQEAFNALLKTLEEPPAHVLFILATTEVQKIPQTILSRCQRLDFSQASFKDLKEALERIIKAEKINIEEEAIALLVKKADGSFRDGVKLLDQVVSLGGKITSKSILENLKTGKFDDSISLIQNFTKREISNSLINVQKSLESGTDSRELILSLMDTLRSLVFIKNGVGNQLIKPQTSEDQYDQLVNLSKGLTNVQIVRFLDILQNSLEKLKFASIPSLPLELAVVEICGDEKPVITRSETTKQSSLEENRKEIATATPDGGPRNDEIEEVSASPDIIKLKEKWTFVLETIRPYNFSLEALLRSVRVSSITDSTVVMEVPYSFHQRIMDAPKNRDILEGVLSDVLGRSIRVSVILGNRSQQKQDLANIEVAEDDEIVRIASEIFNSDSVN